jgi:hypothetical protein
MSLDISLYGPSNSVETICPCCGNQVFKTKREELFSANITHNLNNMASAAGIYEYIWRPSEVGVEKAQNLIEPLTRGLETLRNEEDIMKAYNPTNGWGSYETLVNLVENYLEACKQYPDATVEVCR